MRFDFSWHMKKSDLKMCDFTRVWEDWHPIGILLAS